MRPSTDKNELYENVWNFKNPSMRDVLDYEEEADKGSFIGV